MPKLLLIIALSILLTGCGFGKEDTLEFPVGEEPCGIDYVSKENALAQAEAPCAVLPEVDEPIPPTTTDSNKPEVVTTPPVRTTDNQPETEEPVVTPPRPFALPQPVLVDSVSVMALESYPVQYRAIVKGNLRNGCEMIYNVEQSVEGKTINLTVNGQTHGEICTQALVPFSETVSIDASNLEPGEYTLKVNNEVTTQFNVQ